MSATVKLTEPVTLHQRVISEVTIKAPRGALYARLGEPRLPVFNVSGSVYHVEQNQVINEYFDALIEHDNGGAIVFALLSLEDAKRVKEELFRFFDEADGRLRSRTRDSSSSA